MFIRQWFVSMLCLALLSACQTTPSSDSQNPESSPSASPAVNGSRAFLDEYFAAVKGGSDGTELWCEIERAVAKKLFAVQDYTLVKERSGVYEGLGWGIFTVQVNSSTQGGAPVRKNWLLRVGQDPETKRFCLKELRDADKYPDTGS